MAQRIIVFGSGCVDFRRAPVDDISPLLRQIPKPGDEQRLIYLDERLPDIIRNIRAGNIEPYQSELGQDVAAWLPLLTNDKFEDSFGGKGSNTAFAAGKIAQSTGVDVHFFGAFGGKNDRDADRHIAYLQDAGVKVDVQRIEGETLSQNHVFPDKARRQATIIRRGANKYARVTDAMLNLLDAESMVVIQTSIPVEQSMIFAREAKVRGAQVIFNCTNVKDVKREHFDLVDELVVNLDEAENIAKKFGIEYDSHEELARNMARDLGVTCIITRGGDSVFYAQNVLGEYRVYEVPVPAIRVVNVTGAGDALLGTYVAMRAQGHDVGDALCHAVEAGALTATCETTTAPSLSLGYVREKARGNAPLPARLGEGLERGAERRHLRR